MWKDALHEQFAKAKNDINTYNYFPILNEHQVLKVQIKQKSSVNDSEFIKLQNKNKELLNVNANYSARVLKLIDETDAKTSAISALEERVGVLEKDNLNFSKQNEDFKNLIKEKDRVIEVIKDELHLHQLELTRKDELLREYKGLRNKIEIVEFENQELKKLLTMFEQENKLLHEKKGGKVSSEPIQRSSITKESKLVLKETICNIHDQEINCMSMNFDGSLLATGGNDRKVVVYSPSTSRKFILQGASQGIMSTNFLKSSNLVLASSNDNSAFLWNFENQRLLHTLTGHLSKIFSAKFIDPNTVVTGSHDRTIKLWDLRKGYCTKTMFTLSSCNDLAPIGEGSVIVSGHLDNNIRIWDSKSGTLVRELTGIHSNQITSVQTSTNGNTVSTLSRDNTCKVLDIRMYDVLETCGHPQFKVASNWTKHWIGDSGKVICGSADGLVFIWQNGEVIHQLSGHKSGVVAVASNGDHIFSAADKERVVKIWQVC